MINKKEVGIPQSLLLEIKKFSKRNNLVKQRCCLRCLKAHIIKRAIKINSAPKTINRLSDLFNCEIGHNGYYTDKGTLIKL